MATPKSKLDLSSIGWEYCEIRGKKFSDLLAVRLRLKPNLTRGVKIASADKSALTKLGFVLVGSELERTTPSAHGTVALTKREISMVFREFDADTMVVHGERNVFEPKGEFISFSTHQTVSVPQAMLAVDHETGKIAGELQEPEFNKLVQARTISLSNLRSLHLHLDPNGKFGETAVFHVIEKIRESFNAQVDTTDEIALFSVDGKTFNPPLRIVYDDSLVKPSVFSDIQAYRKNLKAGSLPREANTKATIHDEVARGIFQKAIDASDAFVKAHPKDPTPQTGDELATAQQSPTSQTLSGRSFVVPKPTARSLPSFAAKSPSQTKAIDVDNADRSVKKMFGGDMERKAPAIQETRFSVQQQAGQQRSLNDGEPLSITDFLREQSLLKLSFKAVLKKIPELFAQYARGNPHIDEPFFNRATRMFIREESLRIMAGIAAKQVENRTQPEVFTPVSRPPAVIEDDDLFEVGSFAIHSSPERTEHASSSAPSVYNQASKEAFSAAVGSRFSSSAIDEFAEFEKPSTAAPSSPAPQASQTVSRPGGGFMSKLKGSVENTSTAADKPSESTPVASAEQSVQHQPAAKNSGNLDFSSAFRKPSAARPLPNFGR